MIDVLVADDQVLFAQLLQRVLDGAPDMRVVGTARTAAEAEELARDLRPDVVLLDFRFPDGNGIAVAKQILRDDPQSKIVMLTAIEDETILLAAIEAGCSGFLTKHRALEDVEDAVRAVASGDAPIEPEVLARVLEASRRERGSINTPALTSRELEILVLAAEGCTNPEIARRLVLSVKTVGNHVQNILSKLEAHSKLEAVAVATRRGLLPTG